MIEERFAAGDMDRNEVEMDLNKFMAMIQEISDLKDKIRDLEADDKVNPHQKWIHLAKAVDSGKLYIEPIVSLFTAYIIGFHVRFEPYFGFYLFLAIQSHCI